MKYLEQEIDLLKSIHHENIISLKYVFETKLEFRFIMDLATGGDLYERIVEKERYSESEAKQVMIGILSVLLLILVLFHFNSYQPELYDNQTYTNAPYHSRVDSISIECWSYIFHKLSIRSIRKYNFYST